MSSGQGGIPNEFLEYCDQCLTDQLTFLIRKIFSQHRISDEWRTILMYKKVDKKISSIQRGINLLSTKRKFKSKRITNEINSLTSLTHELQDFRAGRSCQFCHKTDNSKIKRIHHTGIHTCVLLIWEKRLILCSYKALYTSFTTGHITSSKPQKIYM